MLISLLGLLCNPEDGGGIFLWNIGGLQPDYVVLEPRMSYFSYTNLLHQLERNVPFGPQHENYDSGFYSSSLLKCILLVSLLHFVDVGFIANISEVHTASIFRVGLKSWRWRHLWNVGNTAHMHKVQRLEIRMHINNENFYSVTQKSAIRFTKYYWIFLKSSCYENLTIPCPANILKTAVLRDTVWSTFWRNLAGQWIVVLLFACSKEKL
jgi:hypothetical protein